AKHEMIRGELTPSCKQFREAHLALRAVKDIVLRNSPPREFAPLPAQIIAQSRKLLLLGQQLAACPLPLGIRYHRMFNRRSCVHENCPSRKLWMVADCHDATSSAPSRFSRRAAECGPPNAPIPGAFLRDAGPKSDPCHCE